MPFQLPKPRFDAALVEEIETHQDMWYQTEIVEEDDAFDGLIGIVALGGHTRGAAGLDIRPMFQLFPDGDHSTSCNRYPSPCPDCDNWAYTSKCTRHTERGIGDVPVDTPEEGFAPPLGLIAAYAGMIPTTTLEGASYDNDLSPYLAEMEVTQNDSP